MVDLASLERKCTFTGTEGSNPSLSSILFFIPSFKSLLFIVLFSCSIIIHSQTISENWIPLTIEKEESLFINVAGLSNFTGNEFYLWSLRELSKPMSMEGVSGDIYKIKTYYHIDKEIKRYSILQIIYYDEKGNVLKQYSYEHKLDKTEFKFNYPVKGNRDLEKIVDKSLEFLGPAEAK